MRRNYVTKLMVMMLTIVLCIVATMPTLAKAASEITLKNGKTAPSTVYTGRSYDLKVGKTSVEFYSSDDEVATIGLTTGKMQAVAPGEVTITAKSKSNGKVIATKDFKVNQRATSVTSSTEELYLGIGEAATLEAVKVPATSTDVIKFVSSDKSIASVNMKTGKVIGMDQGVATVTIYSMATSSTKISDKNNKTTQVKIYVGNHISQVKQIELNKFEVTFLNEVDANEFSVSDFKVTANKSGAEYEVREVFSVENNTKAIYITTFNYLKDGAEYTISYGNTSGQFKASDGVYSRIEVYPTSIPCRRETEVCINVYDENGILIKQEPLGAFRFDDTVDCFGGIFNREKNTIWFNDSTEDSYAKVNVIFHSYKYKDGIEVGNLTTGDVKIYAAEEPKITESSIKYTFADKDKAVDFRAESFRANKKVSVGDQSYNLNLFIADNYGDECEYYEDYYVVSSDENIFKLSGDLSNYSKKVSVKPFTEGTAYVIVQSRRDNSVIAKLPVTVVERRVATEIYLEKVKYTAKISDVKKESETFTVHIMDQFGDELNEYNGLLFSQFSIKAVDKTTPNNCISVVNNKVTIYNTKCSEGTYTFKVGYQKLSPVNFKITYKK